MSHSVRELVEIAFGHVGLDWQKHVEVDPALLRPAEVDHLIGDCREGPHGVSAGRRRSTSSRPGRDDGRRRPRAAVSGAHSRAVRPPLDESRRSSPARSRFERHRPARSASSASATSACRSPSSSPTAGFDVTGFDVDESEGRRDQRRAGATSPTCRPTDLAAVVASGQLQRDDRHVRARRHGRASTSACRRRCARPRIRTCPTSSRRSRRSRQHAAARASWSSSSRPPTRARPTKWSSRCSRQTGLKAGEDFFLAFSPERVDPGNPQYHDEEHPEGRRRHRHGEHRGRLRALRRGRRQDVVPVSSTRVAEMVKLLENTFRAVNIGLVNETRADVPPDGHRRVGSHRRGEDQAVRLHAVLPGPRPRRPLHPDRSVLPVVEGAPERLRVPVHRAGRPGQRLDARVRRARGSPTR